MTSDSDIDAATPIFARYSRWTGETDRNTLNVRSRGLPVTGLIAGVIGEGV